MTLPSTDGNHNNTYDWPLLYNSEYFINKLRLSIRKKSKIYIQKVVILHNALSYIILYLKYLAGTYLAYNWWLFLGSLINFIFFDSKYKALVVLIFCLSENCWSVLEGKEIHSCSQALLTLMWWIDICQHARGAAHNERT